MDARIALARDYHQKSKMAIEKSGDYREQRDHLIRALRKEDPVKWSYSALASEIGCSPELIAFIVKSAQPG